MINRHYFFIVIVLLVTVLVSCELYFHVYSQLDTVNINNFPMAIDQWKAQYVPIERADLAILETKNAFLRRYSAGGNKNVYLYIAYSQSNPKATNPPEVFYKEAGISILDKGKESIIIGLSNLVIQVNWFILDNNKSQQLAFYWFKVGDIYTHSYWKEQALVAINNLIGKRVGSALIRISADIIDGHENEAHQMINEFASKIGPQLAKYLP